MRYPQQPEMFYNVEFPFRILDFRVKRIHIGLYRRNSQEKRLIG
jgi:hypothetical protein